mgnify:CR=1 FL=1|tara:strand:- start:373 stop:546 length:174 start_codon:yes stop_codon:yes gene_type:complete
MKTGDLVKNKYNGKVSIVTKIEVRRSVPSNRMKTWAYLLGESYRVEKDCLEVLNASR